MTKETEKLNKYQQSYKQEKLLITYGGPYIYMFFGPYILSFLDPISIFILYS